MGTAARSDASSTASADPPAAVVPVRATTLLGVAASLPAVVMFGTGFGGPFDPLPLITVLLIATFGGALRATERREPRWPELVGRLAGFLLLATVARVWDSVARGSGVWPAGTTPVDLRTLATTILVASSFGIAASVSIRAVAVLDATAPEEEQVRSEGVLGVLLMILVGFLVLHAIPLTTVPAGGQWAVAGAVVLTLGSLAAVRGRARVHGGIRPPLVDRPGGVLVAASVGGLGAIVLATALLAPVAAVVEPPDVRPLLAWVGDRLDGLLGGGDPPLAPELPPPPADGDLMDELQLDEDAPDPSADDPFSLDWSVPWWVGALLIAAVVAAITRPARLRAWWRSLRARVGRGPRTEGLEDVEVTGGEDAGTPGEVGGVLRDRLRAWGRALRPRPREPRAAILHDYARLQRVLARRGDGRGASETPLDHARRVSVAPQIEPFASLVSEARWAAAPPSAQAAARSRALVEELIDAVG
ncbi:MAG: DUF4129 domain-containing protein [Nitriliruptoraceae bacterium]|nr:DUF4129 domain-containing protein [Nitriliruptoraceae bacterium]